MKNIIKNMSYTISSNLISFIVSTLVILIVPKLIGVENYGYWQLYLFYATYVGLLHFGWNDGIYLRFGGDEYNKLDKRLFFSQFMQLLITQIVIGILIFLLALIIFKDINKEFIFQIVALVLIISNTRLMLLNILQTTNRIKEYAIINMLDRIIYVLLIIFFLLIGIRDFKLMVIADVIGKLLSLSLALYYCRDIVFNKINKYYLTLSETYKNINVGIKIMFANFASFLIIGIVRFGIERTWDVSTFGKVALTISLSSIMMFFISAVGIVIFPILKRINKDKLSIIYKTMRDSLLVLLLGILIIYYPLKAFMVMWLPNYADSLIYLALVFPMFIYEGKMVLLINTYINTLRKENIMFKINIIMMIITIIITYINTQIFNNLDLTVISIVILLIIRSVIAELYLAKALNIKVLKDIILEILLTTIFILSAWFIDSYITIIIYIVFYIIYLLIKKKDLIITINNIKDLLKNK